jgi:hypothetical protein
VKANEWVLYPNPSNERIFIKYHQSLGNQFTYKIFNALGQSVLKGNDLSNGIDISMLPIGNYYFTLQTDKFQQMSKMFVKE